MPPPTTLAGLSAPSTRSPTTTTSASRTPPAQAGSRWGCATTGFATLWWRGLGVVDGRLVLDVRHQPHGPHAGRLVATVIDWAGDTEYGETTTRPGWVSSTDVPLLRDRTGRWHLADPTVGTTIRRVDQRLR